MKNNVLEYKKYLAELNFDLEDNIIIGRVTNAKDTISFHGGDIAEIKQAFHDIVDTYLEACAKEGITASKPYSGKFNLRVNPDLHRELSIEAAQDGTSLNDLIQELLRFSLAQKPKKFSN